MRVVCEQVSHHPPVSAFHVESKLFTFHGSVHPKIKFWGKSIDVTPKGLVTLYLTRYALYFIYFVPSCIINFELDGCVVIVIAGVLQFPMVLWTILAVILPRDVLAHVKTWW